MDDAPTLGQVLYNARHLLRGAGLDAPDMDARLLIQAVLGVDREYLLTQRHQVLSPERVEKINALLARRVAHEPVSRILGEREFWGLPFRLSPDTLDPRPDTETVVRVALELFPDEKEPLRILDLGTGTGCILLALLYERRAATGLGIDAAAGAVQTAQGNADRLGMAKRATFQTGFWTQGLTETFDLIVSNPPYIAQDELPTLEPDVINYDPLLALTDGADGLSAYRALVSVVKDRLKDGGWVLFEVGAGQAPYVTALLATQGLMTAPPRLDYGGIPRVVMAQKPQKRP